MSRTKTKTVVVLGAAYAGHRATQLLVDNLPHGWRVVVIERNTHFNHLYAFPRVSVLPGHEHKVFIPYTNLLRGSNLPCDTCDCEKKDGKCPHLFVHGNVTKLEPHRVFFQILPDDSSAPSSSSPINDSVEFDYLIYALGSKLPRPINLWDNECEMEDRPQYGTKIEGCNWHRSEQGRIRMSRSILVVGGGALGIQYASDIACLYPNKSITLVHSGPQLLPRFSKWMHDKAVEKLEELGVNIVLNSRVDLSSVYQQNDVECESGHSERLVHTFSGKVIPAESILLCTGQKPNVSLLQALLPECVNKQTGAAYVTRAMQLANAPSSDDFASNEPLISQFPHIYVAGDAADAFGALKAGHTAWAQAAIAAHNVVAEIKSEVANPQIVIGDGDEDKENGCRIELKRYEPPLPAITVSLGLKAGIYQRRGECGEKAPEDCHEALDVHLLWTRRGLSIDDMTV